MWVVFTLLVFWSQFHMLWIIWTPIIYLWIQVNCPLTFCASGEKNMVTMFLQNIFQENKMLSEVLYSHQSSLPTYGYEFSKYKTVTEPWWPLTHYLVHADFDIAVIWLCDLPSCYLVQLAVSLQGYAMSLSLIAICGTQSYSHLIIVLSATYGNWPLCYLWNFDIKPVELLQHCAIGDTLDLCVISVTWLLCHSALCHICYSAFVPIKILDLCVISVTQLLLCITWPLCHLRFLTFVSQVLIGFMPFSLVSCVTWSLCHWDTWPRVMLLGFYAIWLLYSIIMLLDLCAIWDIEHLRVTSVTCHHAVSY